MNKNQPYSIIRYMIMQYKHQVLCQSIYKIGIWNKCTRYYSNHWFKLLFSVATLCGLYTFDFHQGISTTKSRLILPASRPIHWSIPPTNATQRCRVPMNWRCRMTCRCRTPPHSTGSPPHPLHLVHLKVPGARRSLQCLTINFLSDVGTKSAQTTRCCVLR